MPWALLTSKESAKDPRSRPIVLTVALLFDPNDYKRRIEAVKQYFFDEVYDFLAVRARDLRARELDLAQVRRQAARVRDRLQRELNDLRSISIDPGIALEAPLFPSLGIYEFRGELHQPRCSQIAHLDVQLQFLPPRGGLHEHIADVRPRWTAAQKQIADQAL